MTSYAGVSRFFFAFEHQQRGVAHCHAFICGMNNHELDAIHSAKDNSDDTIDSSDTTNSVSDNYDQDEDCISSISEDDLQVDECCTAPEDDDETNH